MKRIVSLLPSATEIICALGLREALFGRSHECDFPPDVQQLPALTAPRFALDGSSRQLDQRVKTVLESARSVYRVDVERLRQLRPDTIVTQTQCEVCAVDLDELQRVMQEWDAGARPALIALEAASLEGVFADIERVAQALEVAERGIQVVAGLHNRIDTVAQRAQQAVRQPTLAFIEWLDPPMAGGNWIPELVARAGARDLFVRPGEPSPWIDLAQLQAADPDLILIAPCGFNLERSWAELGQIMSQPGWAQLRAVRQGAVTVADGNQYFNRPGPRLVESLEIIAEIAHPELFDFGHQGRGWRRWSG
jgi:iron complex transport system substrate-binding protein